MRAVCRVFLILLLILPSFALGADTIDINTADKTALMTINGVGERKAEAIISYREQYGPFRSVEELTEVQGIGPRTLEDNRDRLVVGNPD